MLRKFQQLLKTRMILILNFTRPHAITYTNLSNLLDLRNVCIFVLAFAGFFRINEVLHIKYGDVRFQSGYVAIDVTSSKTDQLRKGSEVVIASGSSIDTCPFNILRRYLTEVERYPIDSSHYILGLFLSAGQVISLFLLISQLVTLAFVIILSVVSKILF